MTILVIAEHDKTALKSATQHVVAAAQKIGGEIHVLVAGHEASAIARAASNVAGVTKVLHAEAPHFASPTAEAIAALAVGMAEPYSHILLPATSFGKDAAPRIAALLDVAQVSDIIEVKAPDTFVRPVYAGNALETVKTSDKKIVATVRTTAFASAGEGGSAAVETITAPAPLGLASFEKSEISVSERPELTAARIVVSGGRGMQSGENFKTLIEPLADRLGAAVGASRAAVDAGYMPNDHQVGQTGKVVAPELYIAVGISGAIQHLAGMKDSKVIVAINKDAEAPIFQIADYGLVGDLFTVLPELDAELKKAGY